MAQSMNRSDAEGDQEQLGARLREAREYLGLSQETVAEYLGVPRASISVMEAGKRKVSSLELRDLSRLYKRPISHFLGDKGSVTVPEEETAARAIFRATKDLSPSDRQQVIRFAEFLRAAGHRGTARSRASRRSK
jgi:transcriptional regulator with XRE-family HTH domain